MKKLVINKNISFAEIEECLALPNFGSQALKIPNKLYERGALGLSMQFIQFLLTWCHEKENSTFYTYLDKSDEKYKKFTSESYGLAAAFYSSDIKGIEGEENIRLPLLKSARSRIKAMNEARLPDTAYSGSIIEFIFIEGAKYNYHNSLYAKVPTPEEISDPELHKRCARNALECNIMLRECLKNFNIKSHVIERLLTKTRTYDGEEDGTLGRLLSEAFENTCLHASRGPNGSMLEKNLRCVKLMRHQTVMRDHIENFKPSSSKTHHAFEKYFYKLSDMRDRKTGYYRENMDLLELSIFDSGPGFAATIGYGGNDVEAVAKCFDNHISAKAQANAGKGLYRILCVVKELGGFLRLRTDTVEAFFCDTSDFTPSMPGIEFVHGGFSRVEGTLITVGIPLSF